MKTLQRLAGAVVIVSLVVVFALIVARPNGASTPESSTPNINPDAPNVLIVITDDQRASGTLGAMSVTRRIFGRGGTKFKWAIATTPQCCPSRASILSGQYAHNHRVTRNDLGDRLNTDHTVQHELHAAGYQTAIVGKYLNGGVRNPPNFDSWVVGHGRYANPVYSADGQHVQAGYSTTFLASMTLEMLEDFEESDSVPWLLIVSTWAPHRPAIPEPQYENARVEPLTKTLAMAETDISDKPAYVQEESARESIDVAELRADQLRTLMSVDDLVGQTFEELEELDEDQSTLAFFLGDNGQTWGEHGIPAAKHAPYDESILVPFFVRWPGEIRRGRVVRDRIVANIDIAPTIYDAVELEPSYAVDGRSVLKSNRHVALIEAWIMKRSFIVPTYRARWTPRSLYVRYKSHRDRREFYGSGDAWQLTNVYKDEVDGNEPPHQEEWDAWLQEAGRCEGSACP